MGLLRNLFATQSSVTIPNQPINPDSKQESETYVAYGTRICGKVNGSVSALDPCLQRIYLNEKHRQSGDSELQNRRRVELMNELANIEGEIDKHRINQESIERQISDNQDSLSELDAELIEVKNSNGIENKAAKIKMYIGIVILAILTLYLFIFYSSTFYSAFFKQFSFDTGVAEAMFDQQALPNAFNMGLGCLIFILCAPIIFMGLGYALHYFSTEKGVLKYIKVVAILVITFVFDCILAYLIAKKIYDIEILNELGEFPEYSISFAVTDVNVWAVIFCGFITYIIWGFVFDLTISAYEEIKSNKKEIEHVKSQIDKNKKEKTLLESQRDDLRTKIAELETKKQHIQSRISLSTYFFDENIIRTALTDFFTGWITLMAAMGHLMEHQNEAREKFNQTISTLFS